jgi:ATP-binding cassette subfamily F protein uup
MFKINQSQAVEKLLEFGLLDKESCLLPLMNLSIGQQRRCLLMQIILQQPDILLLDEPTNHLDCLNAEYLEQQLGNFSGTIVAISHDRYFTDKFINEFSARTWLIKDRNLLEMEPTLRPSSPSQHL